MSMNFPSPAVPGQVYTPVGGYSYVFLDGVWRIVQDAQSILTADTRNRIVNGAMQISQELPFNTNATTTLSYIADQWFYNFVTSGAPLGSASSLDPTGNFIRFGSGSTVDATVAAGDIGTIQTKLEGTRISDFQWGTANAKPIVLRFTARTQGYGPLVVGVSIRTPTGSRSFVKNVTLPGSWQDFVIPIPGDTGGTWATDTGQALLVTFACMAGSNVVGAAESTWLATNSVAAAGVGNIMTTASCFMDIKNVGLYLDPLATGVPPRWQMPDEAEELRACQRYYEESGPYGSLWSGAAVAAGIYYAAFTYLVPKRTTPAVTGVSTGANAFPSTLTALTVNSKSVTENRVANAGTTTATFANYRAQFTVNARM